MRVRTAPWLPGFAGRAALWMGDAVRARQALDRMPTEERRWTTRSAVRSRRGSPRSKGSRGTAAAVLDNVLAGRLAHGDPFTHALITLDAVAVLPADLVPEGAVAAAGAYLEQLGAAALLARLSHEYVRA